MSKKTIRIVAGIFFFLYAALALLLPLPHLCFAALVIGIGLFANRPIVSAVGGIIFAIGILYSAGFRGRLGIGVGLTYVYRPLLIVALICLVILCFVRSAAKILSIVAAILALVAQGTSIFSVLQYTTYRLTMLDYASDLLLSVSLLLIGFAFHKKKDKAEVINNRKYANNTPSTTVNDVAIVKGSEQGVNVKKNFWSVIGILAGIAAIVVGIVLLTENSTYIGQNYSFGADFYTEMYAVTKNIGHAINNAYLGIMSAFGWLFILGGVIDICVFASKVERKKIAPQNNDMVEESQ